MSLTPEQDRYWQKYLARSPYADCSGLTVSAAMPGGLEIADELIGLYLAGKKRAGSGLVKDYLASGDPLPEVGNFWIALDRAQKPRCILRTTKVVIQSFDCVREDVSEAEGEGDLSVEHWQAVHRKFFAPVMARLGIKNLDPEEIVTEFFELVHK